MKAVAPYLRQIRQDAGLTQSEAADRVGIHSKTVERWEAGKHEPPASELAAYVKALGGEVGRLMRLLVGSDEPTNEPNINPRYRTALESLTDEDLDLVIALAERLRQSRSGRQ